MPTPVVAKWRLFWTEGILHLLFRKTRQTLPSLPCCKYATFSILSLKPSDTNQIKTANSDERALVVHERRGFLPSTHAAVGLPAQHLPFQFFLWFGGLFLLSVLKNVWKGWKAEWLYILTVDHSCDFWYLTKSHTCFKWQGKPVCVCVCVCGCVGGLVGWFQIQFYSWAVFIAEKLVRITTTHILFCATLTGQTQHANGILSKLAWLKIVCCGLLPLTYPLCDSKHYPSIMPCCNVQFRQNYTVRKKINFTGDFL